MIGHTYRAGGGAGPFLHDGLLFPQLSSADLLNALSELKSAIYLP